MGKRRGGVSQKGERELKKVQSSTKSAVKYGEVNQSCPSTACWDQKLTGLGLGLEKRLMGRWKSVCYGGHFVGLEVVERSNSRGEMVGGGRRASAQLARSSSESTEAASLRLNSVDFDLQYCC